MREQYDKNLSLWYVQYDSLNEFHNYITKQPINEAWTNQIPVDMLNDNTYMTNQSATNPLASVMGNENFTKTCNFEEADSLFVNGVPDTADKLMHKLQAETKLQPVQSMVRTKDVVGFQPIVPLYLMGVPTNMVNTKMKSVKKKVVNLYSRIDYLAGTSADQIEQECVKKFMLISKLESESYRVNLFLMFSTQDYSQHRFLTTIKLKGANERLNISKLVFPLTHPSMERRLLFRWMEIYPHMPYMLGYGQNVPDNMLRTILSDGYMLPLTIHRDINTINTLDDLKYL